MITPPPKHDPFYMALARTAAQQATCPRASVGAVIVSFKEGHNGKPIARVLGLGYNGSPRGLPHCRDAGCGMVGGHCERAEHAERNALYNAAASGVSVEGAVLYVTHRPCWTCFRGIIQAGIAAVIFGEVYGDPDPRVDEAARTLKIGFRQASPEAAT